MILQNVLQRELPTYDAEWFSTEIPYNLDQRWHIALDPAAVGERLPHWIAASAMPRRRRSALRPMRPRSPSALWRPLPAFPSSQENQRLGHYVMSPVESSASAWASTPRTAASSRSGGKPYLRRMRFTRTRSLARALSRWAESMLTLAFRPFSNSCAMILSWSFLQP